MSTAYYIVLSSEDPGFDPFVDGKALTRRLRSVNKIARKLGLKKLEEFAFHDLSDFGGPELEPEWFDPKDGTVWVDSVIKHIRENAGAIKDSDSVVADLEAFGRVFENAEKRELKWHLTLDY